MHIAFLTTEYPPLPSGGIGTSVRNLARALVAMGHRVTVIGWGPQTAFEDQGVQVRFLGHTRVPKLGWLLNRWRVARELNRLVREEGLNIAEAPDWCGMSAGLIPKKPRSLKVLKSESRKVVVRHCGFRIHCPLVIRCHGTATYFAYLETLQSRLPGAPSVPQGSLVGGSAADRPSAARGPHGLLHAGRREKTPRMNVKPLVRWTERLALRQASSIVAVSRFCAETTTALFGLDGKCSPFTAHGSLFPVEGSGVNCQASAMGQDAGFGVQGSGRAIDSFQGSDAGSETTNKVGHSHASRITHHEPHVPHPGSPIAHPASYVPAPGTRTPEPEPRLFIRVIPNGIDIRQFTPARPDEIEPHTLLYFGTLARKKGVLDLPAIFNRVIEQVPEARLRLIGRDNPDPHTDAPSTWELMQSGFSSAARDRVDYLGMKAYAEVQDYVRRAGVCVFPSYAEAFPVSWLEAMACGKPVVAYDIGWAQEVIEPGVSGSLTRPGDTAAFADAVVACLRSPQRAVDMGLAARRRVEQRFTARAVAERSIAWYAAVCTRASP